MDTFNDIIHYIDITIISSLFPLMLILVCIKLFFNNNLNTKTVLNLVRWIVVVYTILVVTHYAIGFTFYPNDYAFINRATGPYAWAYWLMVFGSCILPFTLLIKKLASNIFYVLLITFLMKIGVYFERFIIIVTSIHRDYLS